MNAVTEGFKPIADDSSEYEKAIFGEALSRDVAVRNYLRPLKQYLSESGATELWINRPGEIVLEVGGEHRTMSVPSLTYQSLMAFATSVAVYSPQQQKVDAANPILSAMLPDGERIQIVMPPAVEPGIIALSIRIPSSVVIPLTKYQESGAFDHFIWPRPRNLDDVLQEVTSDNQKLATFLAEKRLQDFLIHAVLSKKNIAVVGDTGSGKTTLMKSMIEHVPADERLITIEDVRELFLPHENKVHLLYSKSGQGVAKVTPQDLIACCMRMSPSRILLAELRAGEAWDFLKQLTAGHSGSITSWHAESTALAFERFMFMAKENPDASSLSRAELKHLAIMTIDVVIHVKRELVEATATRPSHFIRYVDEVYFDPWAKNIAQHGDRKIG
jgi:type IV secretion system protein VirB11